MTNHSIATCQYFVTYSGVGLPLNLIMPLDEASTARRLTYFCAYYDHQQRLVRVEKLVYGEIEFVHRYEYNDDGKLIFAEIIDGDEDPRVITF